LFWAGSRGHGATGLKPENGLTWPWEKSASPRALTELGELAFLEKDYESAEELLKQALSLDNEMLRAHLVSGFINREKGNYEEALKQFDAVNRNKINKMIYPKPITILAIR